MMDDLRDEFLQAGLVEPHGQPETLTDNHIFEHLHHLIPVRL